MYISKTILIACTLAVLILFLWKCNRENPPQAAGELQSYDWINNAGDIVSSLKGSAEAFSKDDSHLSDSLASVYKTERKKLLEYVVFRENSIADVPPVSGTKAADYFPPKDSVCPAQVKNVRESFSNPYYTADVQIGDSSYMHLQHQDTITVLWKKITEGGLFNRKHFLQLDLSSADPSNKIYGVKAYRKQIEQKKWGIGLQLGYGFSFSGNQLSRSPYVGIGITKTFIRF
jgi:hypothetical protein